MKEDSTVTLKYNIIADNKVGIAINNTDTDNRSGVEYSRYGHLNVENTLIMSHLSKYCNSYNTVGYCDYYKCVERVGI